jgi:hypothetical protein
VSGDDGQSGRDGRALVDAYEAMRRAALGCAAPGGAVGGLALLQRRGLAAWMCAAEAVRRSSWRTPEPTPAASTVGPAAELVTMLAHMVMAQAEEVRR